MRSAVASNKAAMKVMTIIFFMWGFLTSLNDILIPHLKSLFSLNYTQVMLVQFTFFGAYFLMSIPSGKVVAALGYRHSIVVGLLVSALGAFMFYPAAALPSYSLFLAAFFILATGITLLQVAANPYVSLLGEPRTASSRLNLAQALNSLGTTVAPKIGGILILSATVLGADQLARMPHAQQLAYKTQQAHVVQGPYLGLGALLIILALGVLLFRMPAVHERTGRIHQEGSRLLAAPRPPHLAFGVAAIFVYVGAEVSIGSFMINYISLPGIGDMTASHAADFVALYWGGAMLGRFIGAAALRKADPRRLLGISAVIAGGLVMTTMLTG